MKNNWLTLKSLFLCVSALSVSGLILSGCTENANLNVGEWSLEYDAHANGIDISKGSKLIYDNVYAAYKLADSVVSTRDYAKVSIRPRACFSPSYNKVKSQTKHVWLLTLL